MAQPPPDPDREPAPSDPGELAAQVYEELRKRARRILARARGVTWIQPSDLVHDVVLKLVGGKPVDWQGRTHFTAVASRQLRHVLVDHVRAERAAKRGGDVRLTTLDRDRPSPGRDRAFDLLALDEALRALEKTNERRATVVVLRLFGGLTVEEIARYLGVSDKTVKNHWRVAKARLMRELDR
jgi:RNA polymerase sigma factor (TIGR02999 family)